jgi:hypothetical protein
MGQCQIKIRHCNYELEHLVSFSCFRAFVIKNFSNLSVLGVEEFLL